MITIHYGKSFKKCRSIENKIVQLYEAVCRAKDVPADKISYTATKVSCVACLRLIRKRREDEIKAINMRLIDVLAEESTRMEIAI